MCRLQSGLLEYQTFQIIFSKISKFLNNPNEDRVVVKSDVQPGMLLIKIPQTQRDIDHLPKLVDEMRHSDKNNVLHNFSEHQISVNLQLHLFEKNNDSPSTTMCKSFVDTFESIQEQKIAFKLAWKSTNDSDRETTIKKDVDTKKPILLVDVNEKNKNMRSMCSDLTLKMYDSMVKESGTICTYPL